MGPTGATLHSDSPTGGYAKQNNNSEDLKKPELNLEAKTTMREKPRARPGLIVRGMMAGPTASSLEVFYSFPLLDRLIWEGGWCVYLMIPDQLQVCSRWELADDSLFQTVPDQTRHSSRPTSCITQCPTRHSQEATKGGHESNSAPSSPPLLLLRFGNILALVDREAPFIPLG